MGDDGWFVDDKHGRSEGNWGGEEKGITGMDLSVLGEAPPLKLIKVKTRPSPHTPLASPELENSAFIIGAQVL